MNPETMKPEPPGSGLDTGSFENPYDRLTQESGS